MDISGLLTDDLPARVYRPQQAPPVQSSFPRTQVLHHPQFSDEIKQTVFHCSTHARLPLRLELRPNLTRNDLDTLVRTFFGLNPSDVITYMKGDQSFQSIGYEECMSASEFYLEITPDLRYQQHPFAPSQANQRHPSAHISGYGLSTARTGFNHSSTNSSSPSTGRGRRSGSANGTINNAGSTSATGRSRSLRRQLSGHLHPAVEELVDEYVHDHSLYPQQPNPSPSLTPHGSDGRGNKIEPVASAEISLDNIVEGSRRKRAKFSSAELPLFSKPLHPASYSPSSRPPQSQQITTPVNNNHSGYYQQLTPNSASPYSYIFQPSQYNNNRPYAPNFPTPAPTIATDISDEDVALQLMRLGEVSTTSNSPSNNDETADDAGNYSDDQGDDVRSDTTELPELPPPVEEDVEAYEAIQSSPSYPKSQKKFKSLNEILPSYDSTVPSDNEESLYQAPISTAGRNEHHNNLQDYNGNRNPYANVAVSSHHQSYNQNHSHNHHHGHSHNHSHSHKHGDSGDEYEDDDCEDEDDSYVAEERDEDDDADYLEEQRPSSRASYNTPKTTPAHMKPKILNHVKTGRVTKPSAKPVAKTKPKINTNVYNSFSSGVQTAVTQGPLSPSSPTVHRNSISSNQSFPQKSRSTTASISSLPTPVSGVIAQHADSLAGSFQVSNQEEEPEKPKPRCQRCRKSKKGCDRQRPCQRCKDAGIGIDGCISEDETGTRRGRAGGAKKSVTLANAGVKKAAKPKKKAITKH